MGCLKRVLRFFLKGFAVLVVLAVITSVFGGSESGSDASTNEDAELASEVSGNAADDVANEGPDLVFSDVVVEHLWGSSYGLSHGDMPFHIMASVTNHSGKTLAVDALPRLESSETDAFVSTIFFTDDFGEEILEIAPNQTLIVDYYCEVDAPYGDWRFEPSDEIEADGLTGVADRIQPSLQQGFDARSEELARQAEEQRRQAEEQRRQAEEREARYLASSCWVTETGYAYHRDPDCYHISRSTTYEMTVAEAKDEGYEPCDYCDYREW